MDPSGSSRGAPWHHRRWVGSGTCLVLGVCLLGLAGPAYAQAVVRADPARPIVVHSSLDLEALAHSAVEILRRRGRPARLGGLPAGDIPEVSAEGEVTLWSVTGGIEVRLIGPEGRDRVALLPSLDPREESSARVAVFALEALLDAPLPSVAPGYDPDAAAYILRYPEFAPGGELFGRTEPDPGPMPMVILRFMLGFSPLTGAVLAGPGAGLGMCTGGHCLLLEAGLSLLPDDRRVGGDRYRFRAVDTGLRVLLRVWEGERFGVHSGLGLLSRVGEAFDLDTAERRVVSDLAVRTTLEGSVRVAGPFEFVLEGGVDVAVTRATFVRAARQVYLEDRVRPWVVFGVRLRPRMGLEN